MEEVKKIELNEDIALPKAEDVLNDKPKENKNSGSKPKKTAVKRKSRNAEELISAAIKTMTDKEKENLIEYLKSEMHLKDIKLEALNNNCVKAYEKLRMAEEEYTAMEKYYKDRLGFIDQQVTAFGNAVKLSIVGGLN